MLTILNVAYYFGVVLGGIAVWVFICRRFFQVDRQPSDICFLETDDGWRLALNHHPPRHDPLVGDRQAEIPVLLCPGLGVDGSLFDIDADASLAGFLANRGHDVWVLDPRGKGGSSRPRLWGKHPARWVFDDYVDVDLPAAVAEVCRRTGAAQAHVLGCGLGGLAALAVAGGRHEVRELIASCTALGTTAYFGRQARDVSPRLLALGRWLPVRALLRALSPLVGRLSPWPLSLVANLDNVAPGTMRRALVNAFNGFSRRELQQFARWHDEDELRSADGQRDYRELLASISAPVLLVLAPRDRLAPATAVQRTYEAIGADPKALLFAGREGGLSSNYGHLDLLIGRSAPRDIFTRLADWLEEGEAATEGRPLAGQRLDEQRVVDAAPEAIEQPESAAVLDDEEDDLFATDPSELAVGDVPNLPQR